MKRVETRDKKRWNLSQAEADLGLYPDDLIGWFTTKYNPAFGYNVFNTTDEEKIEFGQDAVRIFNLHRDVTSIAKINLEKGNVKFIDNKAYEDGEIKYLSAMPYRLFIKESYDLGIDLDEDEYVNEVSTKKNPTYKFEKAPAKVHLRGNPDNRYPHIKRWERPSNYIGPDWDEYYSGPGKTRDSSVLEESNFEVALERLGGEDEEKGVEVVRDNHWAVGWIEYILVHKDFPKKVKILNELMGEIEDYPVLDEDHYSAKEYEGYQESFESWGKDEIETLIEEHIGDERYAKILKTNKDALEGMYWSIFYDLSSNHGEAYGPNSIDDIASIIENDEYTYKEYKNLLKKLEL